MRATFTPVMASAWAAVAFKVWAVIGIASEGLGGQEQALAVGRGDADLAAEFVRLMGLGRYADITSDLVSIGELPVIDFPGEHGGRGLADAIQEQQLVTLAPRGAFRGGTGGRRQVPFALDLDNLLLHQGQPRDLPDDLPAETFR